MIYCCELCKFKTDRSYDMKVHKLCTKHLKNVGLATKNKLNTGELHNENEFILINEEPLLSNMTGIEKNSATIKAKSEHTQNQKTKKIYLCTDCNTTLSSNKNLWRHKQTCKFKGKTTISLEDLDTLKKTNEEFEELKQSNIDLTNQVKKLTNVVEKVLVQEKKPKKKTAAPVTININNDNSVNTNNVDNSIKNISNVMKYITQTYKLAKPLTMLPPAEAKKMLENTRTTKYSAEDFIVYYYDKHLFDQFIGDVILRVYKKNNPDEQQIWASDVERLSFIIRRALEEGERLWLKDVQGITISQYIINPILEEIKLMITEHNKNCIIAMNTGYKSLDELEKLSNTVYNCAKILRDIDDKVLQEGILRYIIPKFQIT